MDVRRGACEAQAIAQNASAFFSILFGGKDSRLARVARVLVGMDCHYLNNPCPASFPYNGEAQRNGLCSQPSKIAARKTSSN